MQDTNRRGSVEWGLVVLIAVAGALWYWRAQWLPGSVSVSGASVKTVLDGIDLTFQKTESFDREYVVFGGGAAEGNSVYKILLAGLPSDRAQEIARRYPDYYMCASPGADEAKEAIVDLLILPSNNGVLSVLKNAVDTSIKNAEAGSGERVGVRLTGANITLVSAKDRKDGEDFTSKLGGQNYVFVDSAQVVPAKDVAAASGAK
jgi:hypothetical protein